MRYSSSVIQSVVTSPAALRALDYISPIYGEAHAFLAILNAIGLQCDQIANWAAMLSNEAFPQTAESTLLCWELQYALPDPGSISVERRRARLVAKVRNHGAATPFALERIASAAANATASITELTQPASFDISFDAVVIDESAIVQALASIVPAHLSYTCSCAVSRSGAVRDAITLCMGGNVSLSQDA